MKKADVKRSLLAVAERAVRTEVERNNSGHPFCAGFLHQPKRPGRVQFTVEDNRKD